MDGELDPLFDRVVIERIDPKEVTKGGILIPVKAQEKSCEGKVIAAGPGKHDDQGRLIPMQVKKGDHVYFLKYGGTNFEMDGQEYTICKQDEILGRIRKKDNGKSTVS